jgi:hypothetical protein
MAAADRIHATEHHMQPAGFELVPNRVVAVAAPQQLHPRDVVVLALGESRRACVVT